VRRIAEMRRLEIMTLLQACSFVARVSRQVVSVRAQAVMRRERGLFVEDHHEREQTSWRVGDWADTTDFDCMMSRGEK